MKVPAQDWEVAKLMVQAYAEDNVRGKVGYDSETSQWFADLDDNDFGEYISNLNKRDSEVRAAVEDFVTKWGDAVNVQTAALGPPKDNEKRLSIHLIDVDCKASKAFKITSSIKELVNRNTAFMAYGSTCSVCGRKMMVILSWEDVSPKGDKV